MLHETPDDIHFVELISLAKIIFPAPFIMVNSLAEYNSMSRHLSLPDR